jgi:hypothetical protein
MQFNIKILVSLRPRDKYSFQSIATKPISADELRHPEINCSRHSHHTYLLLTTLGPVPSESFGSLAVSLSLKAIFALTQNQQVLLTVNNDYIS